MFVRGQTAIYCKDEGRQRPFIPNERRSKAICEHRAVLAFETSRVVPIKNTLDAGHLFAINLTRRAHLHGCAYGFIEKFAPPLTREVVAQAIVKTVSDDGPWATEFGTQIRPEPAGLSIAAWM